MERALGFAPKPLGMEFQGVAQQLLAIGASSWICTNLFKMEF